MDVVRRSKRLSYVLRHAPDSVGLTLDAAGWADVDALLAALGWTRGELERVVATNDKRRFAFDPTGTRIRASQGHSVAVDLGYAAEVPPPVLFHQRVRWANSLRSCSLARTLPVVISSLVMKLSRPVRMVLTSHAGLKLLGWKSEMLRHRRVLGWKRPEGVCMRIAGGAKG